MKHVRNHWVYLLPLVLGTAPLCALPEIGEVKAGQAEIQHLDPRTLSITTSDRAILHFRKFNISEKEHVQYIQPSSKSSVLNRITGQDPSQILGKLSANGRVFLINPNGIVFGPSAIVNTGSLIASTLNIRDEDFLNDKYQFTLEPGSENSSIVNHGLISAGPEGFVAMFAPFIQNRGSILAKAGKVILASAERVTLDFTGDGLIQFIVDGELKHALIENFGKIEAASGSVDLSMRTAREAIRMVVNTDGITPANALEEVNGVLRLVHTSQIAADRVRIEGAELVEVSGAIDARRVKEGETGGHIEILGDNVQLLAAQIDASGDAGGGIVRIGGEYQGKGETPTAQNAVMNEDSTIFADAYRQGKGGEVILWADETTLFDGKIFARGGLLGGDGGFVETSGKIDLGIETGHVNTSAPLGEFGQWLLDPASITISSGGTNGTIANGSSPNCATAGALNIRPTTLQAAATNVALCAQNAAGSSITVTNAFTMAAGVSISLTAGSTNVGTINLNAGITTRGQPISLTGLVVVGATVTLDTTNAGASPAGANISFSNTINGAQALTLTAGTSGVVGMTGAVGAGTALSSLSATGATITQSSTAKTTGALSYTGSTAINLGGNITTSGGTISLLTGPVTLNANTTLDTTNAGGTPAGAGITINSNVTQAATQTLTVNGGTGGAVSIGGNLGVNAFTVTRSAGTTITGTTTSPTVTLTNTTGNITFNGAATVATAFTTAAQAYGVIFNNGGTITPATTFSNTGGVTLKSGGSASLTFTNGFTSTASATTILGTIQATTAAAGMSMAAVTFSSGTSSLVTNAGAVSASGIVTLTGNPSIDTTNAGGAAGGANVTFSAAVNGPGSLTVTGGTSGVVAFNGAVG
ncbi:MAG: filamentous hemagglutinin N-terminal domain-containing protein, partial [Rhabdochlamydiaceae bacterium]|nr:filamentous hemagglutinin N-terminal domain-containing protein [Rhabdochlamydiaceae bacterium]